MKFIGFLFLLAGIAFCAIILTSEDLSRMNLVPAGIFAAVGLGVIVFEK